MEGLDKIEEFFHRYKTELSQSERPDLLLMKMRDSGLMSRKKYQEVQRLQEELRGAIYDLLDRFAEEKPQNIEPFLKSIFQNPDLAQCPTVRSLHCQLMSEYLPGGKGTSTPGKRKEKTKHAAGDSENERPSSSSPPAPRSQPQTQYLPGGEGTSTPGKRKEKTELAAGDSENERPSSSSPPAPRSQPQTPAPMATADTQNGTHPKPSFPLTVTCGDQKGNLFEDQYEKGQPCIEANGRWYTPIEFHEAAGKKGGNWKKSIYWSDRTLETLLKSGHLPRTRFPRRTNKN